MFKKFLIISAITSTLIIISGLVNVWINYHGTVNYFIHHLQKIEQPIDISQYIIKDITGKTQTIQDQTPTYTLLMLWASWCKYCAEDMPLADQNYPNFKSHDINLLPIAIPQDTPQTIGRAFQRYPYQNLKSYISHSMDLFRALGARGVPYYFIVDQNGYAVATAKPKFKDPNAANIINRFIYEQLIP